MHARFVSVAIVALLLFGTAAQAKGPLDVPRVRALDFLEPHVASSGVMAANIVEALHANGVDSTTWPSEEDAVAWRVIAPPGGSNISVLRPLRALAFANDARADPEGSFTANVLARFTADGYGDPRQINDDAYAILAVTAAGIPADDARVAAARAYLLANGNADGGWGWTARAPSGTDMTGIVLAGLAASGGIPGPVATNASAFLQRTRLDAGFAEMPGGEANCESTVWGIRTSASVGLEVRDQDWDFLLGLQDADGGFRHLPDLASDVLCTTEAFTLLGDAAQGRVPGPTVRPPDDGIPSLGFPVLVSMLGLVVLAVRTARLRQP